MYIYIIIYIYVQIEYPEYNDGMGISWGYNGIIMEVFHGILVSNNDDFWVCLKTGIATMGSGLVYRENYDEPSAFTSLQAPDR